MDSVVDTLDSSKPVKSSPDSASWVQPGSQPILQQDIHMTLSFAPERIEHWPLARLQPYARNAKTHGADQVAKIAASMAEFGWTVPCLVAEDGELIAGHGRVLAV